MWLDRLVNLLVYKCGADATVGMGTAVHRLWVRSEAQGGLSIVASSTERLLEWCGSPCSQPCMGSPSSQPRPVPYPSSTHLQHDLVLFIRPIPKMVHLEREATAIVGVVGLDQGLVAVEVCPALVVVPAVCV